jgi:hypothetical protein
VLYFHLLFFCCLALHFLDVGLRYADHDQVGKDIAEDDGRADKEQGSDIGIDVVGELGTNVVEVSIVDEMVYGEERITDVVEIHQVVLVLQELKAPILLVLHEDALLMLRAVIETSTTVRRVLRTLISDLGASVFIGPREKRHSDGGIKEHEDDQREEELPQ